ncbi:SDR family NAD(P)-dependent oxidoreductase, partial [Pseudomonas aeruginosa]
RGFGDAGTTQLANQLQLGLEIDVVRQLQVRDEAAGLDVLVNNAGEQHPQARLEDISEEQWEKTFRTNIFGMFQLTKAALPLMGKGGAIINTTSITAYKGNPQLIDYSSTKGAITSFTRSLSMNLVNRGIRVNAVCPAVIDTDMFRRAYEADPRKAEFAAAMHPLGRVGRVEEIAAAVLYLCSDNAGFTTGIALPVDGGATAI